MPVRDTNFQAICLLFTRESTLHKFWTLLQKCNASSIHLRIGSASLPSKFRLNHDQLSRSITYTLTSDTLAGVTRDIGTNNRHMVSIFKDAGHDLLPMKPKLSLALIQVLQNSGILDPHGDRDQIVLELKYHRTSVIHYGA